MKKFIPLFIFLLCGGMGIGRTINYVVVNRNAVIADSVYFGTQTSKAANLLAVGTGLKTKIDTSYVTVSRFSLPIATDIGSRAVSSLSLQFSSRTKATSDSSTIRFRTQIQYCSDVSDTTTCGRWAYLTASASTVDFSRYAQLPLDSVIHFAVPFDLKGGSRIRYEAIRQKVNADSTFFHGITVQGE